MQQGLSTIKFISRFRFQLFALALLNTTLLQNASASEAKLVQSKLADQQSVSLTVYSNGRSMIRDRRKIGFDKGRLTLELQDVSAQMRSETAQFRSLSLPAELTVLEQNLEYDLLSPQKLLEKYLGKNVSVIRTHPTNGSDSSEVAEVLSVQNGIVLKLKDRIETGLPGRISFAEVPANLRAQPTLSLLVESKRRIEHDVELNYLSDGINWKADYIADLNTDDDALNLTGFVTLTNQSGTSFRNAQLQLMGGDVQTIEPPNSRYRSAKSIAPMAMTMADAMPEANMQSEAFFEYHLYTLPRLTSVMSNQTKQVSLLQASEVKARKEIVFAAALESFYGSVDSLDGSEDGNPSENVDDSELGTPLKGSVYLAFENNKESHLGMPLPSGIVRVYKRDKNSISQFIGEDTIRHVPIDERVRVRLGHSFDVTARRKRTSFRNIPPPAQLKKVARVSESGIRVVFKNAKANAQKIVHRETIPGEWKILSSSLEYKQLSKDTVEWQVNVPATGRAVLEYKVRVTQAQ